MSLCSGDAKAVTNILFECDYSAGNGQPEALPVSVMPFILIITPLSFSLSMCVSVSV